MGRIYLSPILFIELLAALLAFCIGVDLSVQVSSSVVGLRFLGKTLMFIGVALFILGLSNFLLTREPLLPTAKSLCFSVPLILAMAAFGIFAVSVSSKGGGESVPGKSYKEYHVDSYSKWMQNKIKDNWDNYYEIAVFKNKDYICAIDEAYDQFGVNPAFQSGCCEPPQDCEVDHTSPKVWVKPENGTTYSNDDCNRWDNDPDTLCFHCESCKAGFLQDVTSRWFWVGIWLIISGLFIALLLVVTNVVGCFQGLQRSPQDYAAIPESIT